MRKYKNESRISCGRISVCEGQVVAVRMLVYWQQEWARDERFDSFWRHFDASERWRRSHKEVRERQEEQALYKRPRITQDKRLKVNRRAEMVQEEIGEGPSREKEEEGHDAMDEEMKDFFRKTMQHRAERDARRNAEKKEEAKKNGSHWIRINNEDYIPADKIGVDGIQSRSLAAPNEPAALEEKRNEAQVLYGENWERILSMECEMEMKFRRIFDENQPPMWPMGRKSKEEECEEEVATQVKSRKEFKNKMADRVMKISKNLINEQESDPFGDEKGDEKKGKRKRHLMKDLTEEGGRLSWEEAKKLLGEYSHYGLTMYNESRHVAFPYHLITSIPKSIEFIANAQVGKFRRQVKGIVMAVGQISEVEAVRIMDDQNVFHAGVRIQQIVFRPKKDVAYETVVTMISSRIITSSLFGQITVTTPLDADAQSVLKGITLNTGDTILVKYSNSTVKRSICVLQGTLVRIVKRGKGGEHHSTKKSKKFDKKQETEEIKEEEYGEEMEENVVKKKEKKMRKSEVKMEVDEEFDVEEKKPNKKKKETFSFSDDDSD